MRQIFLLDGTVAGFSVDADIPTPAWRGIRFPPESFTARKDGRGATLTGAYGGPLRFGRGPPLMRRVVRRWVTGPLTGLRGFRRKVNYYLQK